MNRALCRTWFDEKLSSSCKILRIRIRGAARGLYPYHAPSAHQFSRDGRLTHGRGVIDTGDDGHPRGDC